MTTFNASESMIPSDFPLLSGFFAQYANMNNDEIRLAAPLWKEKHYRKTEFFNARTNVCKYLGYVVEGVFRVYYTDEKGEEINVFFFAENQFCVSFKSFATQTPCQYYVEALTNARTLEIHFDDLQSLYAQSHAWERFGRRFAEDCFTVSQLRTESFLFQSPEERYLSFLQAYPMLINRISLSHIASFLGIQLPSLSRIRKRLSGK